MFARLQTARAVALWPRSVKYFTTTHSVDVEDNDDEDSDVLVELERTPGLQDIPSRDFFKTYPTIKPMLLPRGRRGVEVLRDPLYNKGTAFGTRERDRLGLRGLVPPCKTTIEDQLKRVYDAFHVAGGTTPGDGNYSESSQIAKHIYLNSLQDRNEVLFYRLLGDNIKEMAPIIYTPTVGAACMRMSHLFTKARGMWLCGFKDRGDILSIVRNWPERDVDVVVVTDGSRILGLGDLGAHGMPIAVGKLSLYVAAGGIDPTRVLPLVLDMGTRNQTLLDDPLYLGTREARITGKRYFEFLDEVMDALSLTFPKALVQFEDFATPYAEASLNRYRFKRRMFNDDVQGTGTMVLSGVLSALKVLGLKRSALTDQRIVCLGAGSAGLGVCNALVKGMMLEGMSRRDALSRFYLVDVNGLITSARNEDGRMGFGQKAFARPVTHGLPEGLSLLDVIKTVKPNILLGLSGVGGTFKEETIRTLARSSTAARPIIFAMSNPTKNTECTAQQAYDWSDGRCVFASGSPFADVCDDEGHLLMAPSQANNMFIFPGVGLGVTCSRARGVSDRMLYAAATTLSDCVSEEELAQGKVFPDINNIREVSRKIAVRVAEVAEEEGWSGFKLPADETWSGYVRQSMWEAEYRPVLAQLEDH